MIFLRNTRKGLMLLFGFLAFTFIFQIVYSPESDDSNPMNPVAQTDLSHLDPEKIFLDGHLLNLTQDDHRLLVFIRENHIRPPSNKRYQLKSFPTGDPSEKSGAQWKIVYQLLKNKSDGFFVEVGANDGEHLSNTLVLERDFGWTGLLIEGDPVPTKKLRAKNRKAWVANTCVSGVPYPQEVTMYRRRRRTGISRLIKNIETTYVPVIIKCLPLYSILSAIRVYEIDFLSLDVDLVMFPIVRTIPFDNLFIKVLSIQIHRTVTNVIIPFLEMIGYVCLQHIIAYKTDVYLFIHRSLYEATMVNNLTTRC